MRVWNLIGFDLALKVGDIACGCDYGAPFSGEGLYELILVTVSLA
jgi:hypothetical protein